MYNHLSIELIDGRPNPRQEAYAPEYSDANNLEAATRDTAPHRHIDQGDP
jgi:hypothetical protein